MTGDTLALPLLEFLQCKAGCAYLSDLRYIGGGQQAQLARVLEEIPAEAADLRTWNDALEYLAGAGPEPTAEEARTRLIAALARPQKHKISI